MQHPFSIRPSRLLFPIAAFLAASTPALRAADAPATPVTAIAPLPGVVPLQNGDFSLPKVPDDQKWLSGARAENWIFDVQPGGGPGLAVEYWKKDRPPVFFWNRPNGSISQTVDTAKFTLPKAGEVVRLAYLYGGQGKGKFQQISTISVDGKAVATATHDLDAPKGGAQTPATLLYTVKKEDVGKSLGVSFAWSSNLDNGEVQAALRNVVLTVSPPEVAK